MWFSPCRCWSRRRSDRRQRWLDEGSGGFPVERVQGKHIIRDQVPLVYDKLTEYLSLQSNKDYSFIKNVNNIIQNNLFDIDDNNKLIHSLIAKGIMNPDGNYFKPQELVKKIEAIDSIIKACNFPKTEFSEIELPYQDLNKHPSYLNSVKLAYKHKLLSKSKRLNPNKNITKAELISLLYQIPVVKEKRKKIFEIKE